MEKVKSISVICREANKGNGAVAVYVCKKDVDGSDLVFLELRGRFNPELRYYAIDTRRVEDEEEFKEISSRLKKRNIEKEEKALQECGVIVRLR